MKVLVKNLKPNPYRKIGSYPINREKVDSLKNSIQETSFWDNILARPTKDKDKYEIAYGHHRLQAIKELGVNDVDIPVRDLDDATMIKVMANENMENWKLVTSVINETILTAKEYIDGELQKCESLEEFEGIRNPETVWSNNDYFIRSKNIGVGKEVIKSFLGDNWPVKTIQNALSILNSEEIDRKAVEEFETQTHAKKAKDMLKDFEVPKEEQKEIVKKTKEKIEHKGDEETSRTIEENMEEVLIEEDYRRRQEKMKKMIAQLPKEDCKPHISELLESCISHQLQVNNVLKQILQYQDQCDPERLEDLANILQRTLTILKNQKGGIECLRLA